MVFLSDLSFLIYRLSAFLIRCDNQDSLEQQKRPDAIAEVIGGQRVAPEHKTSQVF